MSDSILLISPYRHLAETARHVISSMGLNISVEVCNDFNALQALKAHPEAKIIISRGGTLKLISGRPDLAFVNIGSSIFDVLEAIEKLTRNGLRKIAVITQENIIGLKGGALNIGDLSIYIEPCRTSEDIAASVKHFIDLGYEGIVGCIEAVETAKLHGVKSSFIYSNFFTIKEAILEALDLEKSMMSKIMALKRLGSLVDNIEEAALIFDDEHKPVFYNEKAVKLLGKPYHNFWYEKLAPYINSNSSYPRVMEINGHQILLHNRRLSVGSAQNNVVLMFERSSLEEQTNNINQANIAHGLYAKKHFKDILFKSMQIADCVELAKKFATSDSTVMIFGETGVGKEGFAQSIHNASLRSDMPFVSVNCSSLPQGLVASELFGYAAGAFTGAREKGKKGLFELAQGGTIFLDEITELPLDVQSQILRVIQEREVMRIGDNKVIPLDIRIICAANKHIEPLCREGKFRFDLYYRINVLNLTIPPLRHRSEDIPYLFEIFFKEFVKEPEKVKIDKDALDYLRAYLWPGNVRELKNTAEAISFYGDHVTLINLKKILNNGQEQYIKPQELQIPENISFKELESFYLKQLLKNHSLKEVEVISGISRTTLWRRLKQLDISL